MRPYGKLNSMVRPKVLVVEDDEVILTIEKWRLSNLGFDVCGEAGTGEDALECAAKMQPDIVLMDISLNGEMEGTETARQIKKGSQYSGHFCHCPYSWGIPDTSQSGQSRGFHKKIL